MIGEIYVHSVDAWTCRFPSRMPHNLRCDDAWSGELQCIKTWTVRVEYVGKVAQVLPQQTTMIAGIVAALL